MINETVLVAYLFWLAAPFILAIFMVVYYFKACGAVVRAANALEKIAKAVALSNGKVSVPKPPPHPWP